MELGSRRKALAIDMALLTKLSPHSPLRDQMTKSTFADPLMSRYKTADHDDATVSPQQPLENCIVVCLTYDRLSFAAALPRGRPGEDLTRHRQGFGIPACDRGQCQRIAL